MDERKTLQGHLIAATEAFCTAYDCRVDAEKKEHAAKAYMLGCRRAMDDWSTRERPWGEEPPNFHAPNIGAENDGVDESGARPAAPMSCGDCDHADQTDWAEPSAICRHPAAKNNDYLDPASKPEWCPLGAK